MHLQAPGKPDEFLPGATRAGRDILQLVENFQYAFNLASSPRNSFGFASSTRKLIALDSKFIPSLHSKSKTDYLARKKNNFLTEKEKILRKLLDQFNLLLLQGFLVPSFPRWKNHRGCMELWERIPSTPACFNSARDPHETRVSHANRVLTRVSRTKRGLRVF